MEISAAQWAHVSWEDFYFFTVLLTHVCSSVEEQTNAISRRYVVKDTGMYRMYWFRSDLQPHFSVPFQFWFLMVKKPDNETALLTYYFIDYSLISGLNQEITSSNMKLVTPPTQLSGCPSQTSAVPELLSAHSDGVEL